MFGLKKNIAKRMLRKNAKQMGSAVKRAYRDVSRDLVKKISQVKIPRVTISR